MNITDADIEAIEKEVGYSASGWDFPGPRAIIAAVLKHYGRGDVQDGWIPFNLNDYVRVKLTKEGKAYLQERQDERNRFIVSRGGKQLDYRHPKEDADGWSKWQLWDLMSSIGARCIMGPPVPFETTLEFELRRDNSPRSDKT